MRTPTDPADLPQASQYDHPSDHFLEAYCPCCAASTDAICPKCGRNVEPAGASTGISDLPKLDRAEFYRRFIALMQSARNAKLFGICYLIATGDAGAEGISMTEIAKRWSVKKATISKYCRLICTRLCIPPSRYMREETTVAKFRMTNRRPINILNGNHNPRLDPVRADAARRDL